MRMTVVRSGKRIYLNCLAGLLVLLVLFGPKFSTAQFRRIDSLKQVVALSNTPAIQLEKLMLLCKELNSLPGDTILVYAERAKKLALYLKDENRSAWAEYYITSHLLSSGKNDSVFIRIEKKFKNLKGLRDRKLYYGVQRLKANALNRAGKLKEALDLQLSVLSEAENENDTQQVVSIQNYLGATYLNLNNPAEAKGWWLKAMHIIAQDKGNNNSYTEATICSNLGLLYFYNNSTESVKASRDTCLYYLDRAIQLAKTNEYPGTLASTLVLKGNFLSRAGQVEEAEQNLQEGIAIRNKVGDPFYIMQDQINLSAFYYTTHQYEKSIAVAKEGLTLADAHNIQGDRLQLLGLLGSNYKAQQKYQEYSSILEQSFIVLDSGNRVNSAKQIAEIQTKYEVQKKETQIAAQKFALLKRKYWLYGALVLLVISIFSTYIVFRNYKSRQKLKMELALLDEKKQQELAVRLAEEKERTRIAADLHDNIGVQASAILYGTELLQQSNADNAHVVGNLHDTAKEMLLNLRETLWAMKNTDVPAAELWMRIINFSKQMGRHYLDIRFSTQGVLPENKILESARALNIVMILQEGVNNAVKHSGAKHITINSSVINDQWQIEVSDDGQGFDPELVKEKKDSNGLVNMQERSAAAGAVMVLEAKPGKGTRLILLMNRV